MKPEPADTGNEPVAHIQQETSNKAVRNPDTDIKNSDEHTVTATITDRVSLSAFATARNSSDNKKSPSIPVTREEKVALFESFSDTYRFSIKA